VPINAFHYVIEKVRIEVGPVGTCDVNDELDDFLADETWHRSVMLEQKFVQLCSNFGLFVTGHANPSFADHL
jgi:hypothetical protein